MIAKEMNVATRFKSLQGINYELFCCWKINLRVHCFIVLLEWVNFCCFWVFWFVGQKNNLYLERYLFYLFHHNCWFTCCYHSHVDQPWLRVCSRFQGCKIENIDGLLSIFSWNLVGKPHFGKSLAHSDQRLKHPWSSCNSKVTLTLTSQPEILFLYLLASSLAEKRFKFPGIGDVVS